MPIKISIIIPTCHRGDLLVRCLESLGPENQTAAADSYEVIVTDDARENTVESMVRERFPWAKWIQGPARGPAANRNNGVHHSTGDWVGFTDDDCVASKEWIAAMIEAAKDDSIDMIEGCTVMPDGADDPFLHGISNEKGGYFWSCNIVVRRKAFLALGGFDEDFLDPSGEDIEFAQRFHANQYRSKFCPDVLIYHPVRKIGWPTLWKRLLMSRWAALHAYKLDKVLRLSNPPTTNVLIAARDSIMGQVRRTYRDCKQWNQPYWRCRWFWFAWRWVTYPVIFPYYLYWVYRFQQQLLAKAKPATA